MIITVIGMGKIGLPLAVQFAMKGHRVLGADINENTIKLINEGIEPFPGEMDLQEKLTKVVSEGRLTASLETSDCVAKSDVVLVVVPLFVNASAEPDFASMDFATEAIAKGLKAGTLVSYETTLPIGTTRNRFTPVLEKISKMNVGEDFHVVFSPERVLTGRIFEDLRRYPKIVGGVTENCGFAGANFYSEVLDFDIRTDLSKPNGVWLMDSCESSEFVKLAETTYRDVNIGLANQFARFADSTNLNVYDVIEASNSQPYSHIHQPGIAVGGHCIPIYPQFYLWEDPSASIVFEARKTNAQMPKYALELASKRLKTLNGKSVLILGLAYRAGVKEDAFSGTLEILRLSNQMGCNTFVHDRMYTDEELLERGIKPLTSVDYEKVQVVVIQNSDAENILNLRKSLPNCELVIDGRNLLNSNRKASEALKILTGAEVITLGNVFNK